MPEQTLATWQRWTLRLGLSALTALLAIALAALTWRIIAPEPLILPALSQAQTTQSNSLVFNTAQYHLFGVPGAEPLPDLNEEVSAPETRLRLLLLGVTRATKPELSSAIIASNGGEGEFYRVGSVIQGGTRLAAVYDNRVIIDTNGKLETLKFEELSTAGVTARAVTSTSQNNNKPRSANIRERLNDIETPEQFITMITDEAAKNPQSVIRQLGLDIVGPNQGYRVTEGSVLTNLQLQPGDIVLSVNGQVLGDIEADQTLLEQVSSSGSARIEVQRGNNRFVVNHSLN